MPDTPEETQVLLPVLDTLLLKHPLPWTIERDWTYEVTTTDKTIIAKCMGPDEAQAIIDFAKKRTEQLDSNTKEVEQFIIDLEGKKEE